MKHVLSAGALLVCSALAHAQSYNWAFTYTGFYDHEAAVFLPDAQIAGSFSGTDIDGDGLLERDELTSLVVGSMDYVACAAGSNATYHCGADRFSFSPGGGLSFSLGEYGSDPEGWVGGGHFVETGKMRYEYSFNPAATVEHHLYWTDSTVLDMRSATVVSAIPEPGGWAMLLAGLGVVGLRWRRVSAFPLRVNNGIGTK